MGLTRTRTLLIGTTLITLATLVDTQEAHAQRRRRRRHSTPTTQPSGAETEPPEATPTPTPTPAPAPSPEPAPDPTPAPVPLQRVPDVAPVAPPHANEHVAVATVPSSGRRPAALDLRIGGGVRGRSLWFVDDIFNELRPYNLTAAPSLSAAVEWYPAAHFTRGIASSFGLVGGADYTLIFASSDRQGRSYPTTSLSANGGVRARMWIANRLDAGVHLGYAFQTFAIDRSAVMMAPAQGIPSVTYHSLRGGLSGRMQVISRLAITAASSYLLVLGTGEISGPRYFPRSQAGGVDFELGAAVALTAGLEVRIGLDWRRYFYKMNPQIGDPVVAGGAVDDHYGATISLAYRLEGTR
ncbi:MAG: hypothetical protein Q8Q09_15610 [Deltaproteobacteria bacterium]|nr:hypothetical protein [Deltaproteobacteria bacterium]